MANSFYGSGGDALATAGLNWTTDTIKIQFVDSTYTPDLTAHNNFSDIPAGSRIGTAQALSNATVSEGKMDADDLVFLAVGGGGTPPTITGYAIYKDTGVEATSTLIAFIDTSTGLPLLTNGGDITIQFNALGIAQL